ncbi:MAG: ABC transporter ATP-binding protein, partial [Lachnospiraceae bacterium]|nr:ABC transporter ATP-binding protein [Lachnospiraceae bacterium]
VIKKVSSLSDGNKMKLMLAGVWARDTELLILDEPASPLDPLMRDKLCDMIRGYIEQGNGERSVFFSTHNISDMENVADYAIILEHGEIVEEGFVEDLKEKYIVVKGEAADAEAAKEILFSMSKSAYGFEGICLADNLDKLAGMDVAKEVPTLSQICVAVMKANTKLKLS